jgi:predicted  nucleic acid-binding Zn-ribbon protein
MTFFDANEAERVGQATRRVAPRAELRLDPDIAAELDAARAQQRRIEATVASADLPFAEIREEAARLVAAVADTAARAQRLRDEITAQDRPRLRARLRQLEAGPPDPEREATAQAVREQCAVLDELERSFARYAGEIERINASLGTVHGRLVQAAVASDEARGRELAGDVRELRERAEVLTKTMADALQSES